MKKVFAVLASLGLMMGLASCDFNASSTSSVAKTATTSSSAVQTSEPVTTASSSVTTSAPATSSATTSAPVTTSEPSTSQPTTSAPVSTVVTKTLDLTAFDSTAPAAGVSATDGFFKIYGAAVDGTTRIKTGGYADVSKMNHIVEFTTEGAGTIEFVGSSGSSGKTRPIYLAQVAADGTSYSIIGRQIGYCNDDGSAIKEDSTLNLPAAAKYYLLSTDGYNIYSAEVKYDTSVTAGQTNDMSVTAADADILEPYELYPQPSNLVGDEAIGNYTIHSTASKVWFASTRTFSLNGSTASRTNFVRLAADSAGSDYISFVASGAGTINIFGSSDVTQNSDESWPASNLSLLDSDGNAIAGTDSVVWGSAYSASKTQSEITFSVASAGTYRLSSDTGCFVYYAAFMSI